MQKKHTKGHHIVHHAAHTNISEKNNEDPIHVMLDSPIDLRKGVLGSALDLTKMLKTYAELKEIRETKFALMDGMRGLYNDMNKLLREFEKHNLPHVPEKEIESEGLHETHISEEHFEMPKIESVGNAEIDKLKAELEAIERKLSSL